ncbi:unnamed protein product [Ascophyllum nodosum]
MRLPDECHCSVKIDQKLDAAKALGDCEQVTLKWVFSAGPAYGLVERLIASCHVIGEVEREMCWRYGALFRSHQWTRRRNKNVRLYTFVIRYDVIYDRDHNHREDVLTMTMIGPLADERMWVALRYVASSMVTLSRDWPGVQWKGWPVCPEHPTNRMYLAPRKQARIGDMLLPEEALHAACDCIHQEDGFLVQIVRRRLGAMIDTTEGNPFRWNRIRKNREHSGSQQQHQEHSGSKRQHQEHSGS